MTILPRTCCLDLDTFFVSVERLLDPSLVGKPVVVGATPGHRGVVTACSYEVRALGVRSGMPVAEAVRLAPHAVFLPSRHSVYAPYATRVRAVLERYTPQVRTASIDEFFLDFGGCERLYQAPTDRDGDATIERTVRRMRQEIQDEVGLPASAGIGATRSVAKMASNHAKPAGVHMVRVGGEWAFVRALPVRAFPGIGPVAEAKLVGAGVRTLGELLRLPPGPARARFGRLSEAVTRAVFPQVAVGPVRDRPAFHEHDPEGLTVGSISNERTFRADVGDRAPVHAQLAALCERVCWRARKRDIRARTITLKLRYADFHTLTRGRTVPPTHTESVVLGVATDLLNTAWTRPLAIRLLGVQLSNLVEADRQLALPFSDPDRPEPGRAIDAVRARFGYDAIRLGVAGDRSSWLDAPPTDPSQVDRSGSARSIR